MAEGKMKIPGFPQIHDFRKYRKVIIFISVRSRRKSELESAESFPGRHLRARLGSKGTKRTADAKSQTGKKVVRVCM